MAKKMRKLAAMCMALVLLVAMMAIPAFAKNDDPGTGQTQVHIHLDGSIGENKDSVTIIVGENEYQGSVQGSKLEIEMGTTENGFDFGAGESMEVGYRNNNDGTTGTITLTHKEGNGNNIGKEHDNGLNNFNGSVNKPIEPAPTEPPVVPTEPPVVPTEPPVVPTEPPVVPTEPPVVPTEPPVVPTEPPVVPTNPPAPPVTPVTPPAPQPRIAMVDGDGLITIDDGNVPLADVPQTGDFSTLLMALSSLSAGGLILINKKRK